MTEKDEREQSLIQERRGKGEDLALIQYYYISQISPPRSWDSESQRSQCNKCNESNDYLILTLTEVDLIT